MSSIWCVRVVVACPDSKRPHVVIRTHFYKDCDLATRMGVEIANGYCSDYGISSCEINYHASKDHDSFFNKKNETRTYNFVYKIDISVFEVECEDPISKQ